VIRGKLHAFNMSKGFLWLLGFTFALSWISVLYEQNFHGKSLQIAIHDDSLFIGLSVLLAAFVIAINFPKPLSNKRLPSDYIEFVSKIGDKAFTREELVDKVGETSDYVSKENGPGKYEPCLSDGQRRSLELLIYEGKIILKNGRYSLPKEST